MAIRHQAGAVKSGGSFKGRQFVTEVILWAVRWYLMFPISYRDLELMLADRGVGVDHTLTNPLIFSLVGIGAESAGFVEVSAQSGLEHRGGQGGVESRTGAVAWAIRHHPVSRPRSSNAACGFPALRSPTGFTAMPTMWPMIARA